MDIVERLRSRPHIPDYDDPDLNEWRKRMDDGAREIERLRAGYQLLIDKAVDGYGVDERLREWARKMLTAA